MDYNFAVQCWHRTHEFSVCSEMSTNNIMKLIGSYFDIPIESFELEIYDDRLGKYIDFDDEYVEELQQSLPRLANKIFSLRVVSQGTDAISNISML